jgi:proteasome lid subunit RPN8/RPN11
MTESESVTYAAVITIRLPDAAHSATLTLTLRPGDAVTTAGGREKALRDCTLAELEQFADAVEAELWSAYQATCLAELVADEQAEVEIRFVDQPLDDLMEGQWLDHVVALPTGEVETAAIVEKPDQPALAASEPTGVAEEPDGATEPAAQDAADVALAILDQAEPSVEETKADEEADLAKAVAVAETEPVHAEREAGQVTQPPIFRPHIRILGRRRPVNHPTWTSVDILMNEGAFRDSQAHALSSLDREVAGVLVGPPPEKQPDGRYVVHISDTIIAKHTRMQGASVTYTPESWRYVHDRLAEMYPDESAVIVGWYHTHPGFGIFLSGMDQFIHQNFFTQIWHVALVLDPLAKRSGFFCWDRQKSRVDRYEFPWPAWASASW